LIKFILKLAFLAVLANATWHVFVPYQASVKFKDAVAASALDDFKRSEEEQKAKVLSLANEFDIPLKADGFTLHREATHTLTEGSYTQRIEVFPTLWIPWTFTWHIDTLTVAPIRSDESNRPK
jgi:hypothetical protein